MAHESEQPAPFLLEQLPQLPLRQGLALDLACGHGRHARALALRGQRVVALDRAPTALATLREGALAEFLFPLRADLESGRGIPFKTGGFNIVLAFRFLHRPLSEEIERILAPGGHLLYETFTTEQRTLGYGPSRDAFLLRPGELPTLFPNLEMLHFEEGLYAQPRTQATARLWARKAR